MTVPLCVFLSLLSKLYVCWDFTGEEKALRKRNPGVILFYDIAKGLINRKDEPAYTVIRRIILHGILHISNLDTSKARSLASSYFGKNDSDIMKERMKLEQKKKRIKD